MLVSNQTLKKGFNMCQQNNNTKSKKGKHLNYPERITKALDKILNNKYNDSVN